MNVQTFVSKAAVERFDVGIVRRFSRSRILDDDVIGVRQEIGQVSGEFAAVVTVDALRRIAIGGGLCQHVNDIDSARALTGLDRYTLVDIYYWGTS